MRDVSLIQLLLGYSMVRLIMPHFLLGMALVAALAQSGAAQVDAGFYTSKVKPLLKEKCVTCHGPLRSETGLRLDTAAFITRGSSDGPILVSEQPDQSKILKRLSNCAQRNTAKRSPNPAVMCDAEFRWSKQRAECPLF